MVAKGLKTGDTFSEGRFRYMVDTVNADGSYVSHRIGFVVDDTIETLTEAVKEIPEPKKVAPKKPAPKKKPAKKK